LPIVDTIRAAELTRVTRECEDITSLWFRDQLTCGSEAGQYLMIWLPGIDQVPMSVSMIDLEGESRISVRVVGEMTQKLSELKPGDKIGISGPYGRGYDINGELPLIVAGGSGTASVVPLIREMSSRGTRAEVVVGARTENLLVFVDELRSLVGDNLLISTDDGSRGYKGYASEYAANLMDSRRYRSIYTCGPELMMFKVFSAAEKHGLPIQASLERYIKCSRGLCGSCSIGPFRVCEDGPVFDSAMLREITEDFGLTKKDPTGRSIRLNS
jgi:dihydroorotate dehydrogenase electron transfer subunit